MGTECHAQIDMTAEEVVLLDKSYNFLLITFSVHGRKNL